MATGIFCFALFGLYVGTFAQIFETQIVLPINRKMLDYLRNDSAYNRFATPTQYDGIATNVSMSMYIEGISSFSAQTMDYHLDTYFQQEWTDPRLAHGEAYPMLIRDRSVFKLIWSPDVYFANARRASFQDVTADNFLVWVYPDGKVFYDCRISLSVICMMDLSNYPLDGQVCELRILSYAYPETQLRLQWTNVLTPIERNVNIRMPDMQLIDIKTGYCNGTYATGVWSCVTADFIVQRQIMHHILQTYVPTGLIVVISWFNFWLDIDAAPARVSLSITTLLTISTQANAVKLALPEVSYMKAIDVWMGTCMAFVFGVMIEFTICHFARNQIEVVPNNTSRHMVANTMTTLFGEKPLGSNEMTESDHDNHLLSPPADSRLRPSRASLPPPPSAHLFIGSESTEKSNRGSFINARLLRDRVTSRALLWTQSLRNIRGRKAASKIDERCRYAFPLAFFIFNCLYWTYYLLISS